MGCRVQGVGCRVQGSGVGVQIVHLPRAHCVGYIAHGVARVSCSMNGGLVGTRTSER